MSRTSARGASAGAPRPRRRAAPKPAERSSLSERLKNLAGVLAPTTVIAALLYYFGYVTTYAKYAYFGIDVPTLRMSTQELALQSVAAIFFPLGAILVVGIVAIGVNAAVRAWIGPRSERRAGATGAVLVLLGVALLVRAVVGIVRPTVAQTEPIGVTPACLGLGAVLVAYGVDVATPATATLLAGVRRHLPGRRVLWSFVLGLAVLSSFWLANSFAGAYGRGQAEVLAATLVRRPSVVLDTRDRLYLTDPAIVETSLPPAPGQQHQYRYRNLRLLVAAGNRLFLVPEAYQRGSSTVLVLPDDGTVRLQFAP
ncbi:hypothetical protein [Actinomycetospora aeridis]|uniref:DUF2079 domain-containing protein n=1 Tax=Actinomycetospora aeridis TaxID=3129231 RepID=A0ABU8N113_9PSEU